MRKGQRFKVPHWEDLDAIDHMFLTYVAIGAAYGVFAYWLVGVYGTLWSLR